MMMWAMWVVFYVFWTPLLFLNPCFPSFLLLLPSCLLCLFAITFSLVLQAALIYLFYIIQALYKPHWLCKISQLYVNFPWGLVRRVTLGTRHPGLPSVSCNTGSLVPLLYHPYSTKSALPNNTPSFYLSFAFSLFAKLLLFEIVLHKPLILFQSSI